MRHQWGFLFREAFRNLRADRFLSVTSVITLGICASVLSFLLLGLSLMSALDAKYSRSALPLRVFIRASFERPEDLKAFEAKLPALGSFDSVVFVSKDQALKEFTRDFGPEMTQYLEVNPLPHSYRLYPSGAPLSGARVAALRRGLLGFKEVEEVSGNFTQLEWLDRWRVPLQTGSLILLACVAGALALIVHNAIKLSLYARRNLVQNMKYCGATGFFILAPFALEALLLGIGGGLLGSAALFGQIELGKLLVPSLPRWIPETRLVLYLLGGTAGIALLSSMSTVHAFLRGRLE